MDRQRQGLAGNAKGIRQLAMGGQPQPGRPLLGNGLSQCLLNTHLLTQPFRLECIKLYKLVHDLLTIHLNTP
ncbi:hypothetical protein EHLJMEHL_03949 [Vreelandella titanicae]